MKDRVTGKPLYNFMLQWGAESTKIGITERGMGGVGGFSRWTTRTSIPAEKGLSIEVSARGYKKWVYVDPPNPSRRFPLRVQHGEIKSLNIELQPEAEAAPTAHYNRSHKPRRPMVACLLPDI